MAVKIDMQETVPPHVAESARGARPPPLLVSDSGSVDFESILKSLIERVAHSR